MSGYDLNLQATFEVKTSSSEPVENVTIKAENAQAGLSGYFYLGDAIGIVSTNSFYIGQFLGEINSIF